MMNSTEKYFRREENKSMKNLKKIIGVVCMLAMVLFCITACGNSDEKNITENNINGTENNINTTENRNEDKNKTTSAGDTSEPVNTEKGDADISENAGEDSQNDVSGRVLVAYFSATGNTRVIAEYAADAMNADLYEIVPENPYTSEDLNYNDNGSRTSIEMNDASARPAISGSVENIEQYDIIFLGYPIWWGEAPRIMCTFVESYDLSGKTIVPFCTSGSSGVGSSVANLHGLTSDDVVWLDGTRFGSGASRDDIVEWINALGLSIEAE